MTIKCPKCSAMIEGQPDELGLVACGQCGARLRSKQQVKVTVQGGPSSSSSSSPSLPRIDPTLAAPADVDHVLARLDTPSPDATVRPGALPRMAASGSGTAGAVFDMLLNEIKAIKKTQQEILALLKSRPSERSGAGDAEDDDAIQRPAARDGGEQVVLLVDDDPHARQEAASALKSLATVKTASDGNSALATIALEKPNALVLELALSGAMPGRDLVNMIKATMEWVDIPIVLYTKMPVGDAKQARQLHGADEVVSKGPGSARTLAAKVGAILNRG